MQPLDCPLELQQLEPRHVSDWQSLFAWHISPSLFIGLTHEEEDVDPDGLILPLLQA